MQGGVYKRRLSKCFHATPSCFRTPPTPHHAIGYHFSLRQQFRQHQYSPERPYRKMHHVCGTSANIAQNCSLLAELPQILHKIALCLRNFRKYCTKIHLACGTSARITKNCILFAGEPQISRKSSSCLRNFRKNYTKLHITCGTSANIAQKCILLAELPQMACNLRIHLIVL